jgi:hypothetical protein
VGSRSPAAFVVIPCAYGPLLGGSSSPASFTIDFFIGFAFPQRLLARKLRPRSLAHAWGSDGFATVIGFALPQRLLARPGSFVPGRWLTRGAVTVSPPLSALLSHSGFLPCGRHLGDASVASFFSNPSRFCVHPGGGIGGSANDPHNLFMANFGEEVRLRSPARLWGVESKPSGYNFPRCLFCFPLPR